MESKLSQQQQAMFAFFNPRLPKNLQVADELQNLASINDMRVQNLTNEPNPQIYLACGKGS